MIPGFGRSEVFVIDNQYNHHLLQPSLQSLQLLFLSVLLIADFPIIRTSIGSPSPQALKPPEASAQNATSVAAAAADSAGSEECSADITRWRRSLDFQWQKLV